MEKLGWQWRKIKEWWLENNQLVTAFVVQRIVFITKITNFTALSSPLATRSTACSKGSSCDKSLDIWNQAKS